MGGLDRDWLSDEFSSLDENADAIDNFIVQSLVEFDLEGMVEEIVSANIEQNTSAG